VLLVLALLGGTAAAFAYTEGLKQTKSPVYRTRVTKLFSPTCPCPERKAFVVFTLRRADHVTVSIVDSDGTIVRTLVDNAATPAGDNRFVWDGTLDDGKEAADGVYKPRIELDDADRTLKLPNSIRLDSTPPRIVGAAASLGANALTVRYRFDGPARALVFVGGRRVRKTFRFLTSGTLEIPTRELGQRNRTGGVSIQAEDLAGNESKVRLTSVRVP